MILLLVAVINILIFLLLLPPIQELIHWFVLVGVRVRASKYDDEYGISLDLPEPSDENIISCI